MSPQSKIQPRVGRQGSLLAKNINRYQMKRKATCRLHRMSLRATCHLHRIMIYGTAQATIFVSCYWSDFFPGASFLVSYYEDDMLLSFQDLVIFFGSLPLAIGLIFPGNRVSLATFCENYISPCS